MGKIIIRNEVHLKLNDISDMWYRNIVYIAL